MSLCEGFSSRCSRDANPYRTASAVFCSLFLVSWQHAGFGVPFFSRDANPRTMACAISFFLNLWHPVFYGTPALAEWPEPYFFPNVSLCRFVRVGFFFLRDANPRRMAGAHFFSFSSCLKSRPSEKSRMRCPDVRGREIWDWA